MFCYNNMFYFHYWFNLSKDSFYVNFCIAKTVDQLSFNCPLNKVIKYIILVCWGFGWLNRLLFCYF